MKNSCLIVAGEKSGEEHGLSFFSSLKQKRPETSFWGVGGDELEKEGLELLFHLRDFSSWGLSRVVKRIPFYLRALKRLVREAERRGTKSAILIDFQEFNFLLARGLRRRGVRVFYYVAPQAWAWRESRVSRLARDVHTLFTLLPFEKRWFQDRGVKRVVSVDHPVLLRHARNLPSEDAPVRGRGTSLELALLPGSRNFEVHRLLPVFLEGVRLLREKGYAVKTHLVCSSSVHARLYGPFQRQCDQVSSDRDLAEVLKKSDYAFAAGGTVTLSCALFQVPTVVAYEASLFDAFLIRNLFRYGGLASLANLIYGKSLFPELLQERASAHNMAQALEFWILNPGSEEDLRQELLKARDFLKGEGMDVAEYMAQHMEGE